MATLAECNGRVVRLNQNSLSLFEDFAENFYPDMIVSFSAVDEEQPKKDWVRIQYDFKPWAKYNSDLIAVDLRTNAVGYFYVSSEQFFEFDVADILTEEDIAMYKRNQELLPDWTKVFHQQTLKLTAGCQLTLEVTSGPNRDPSDARDGSINLEFKQGPHTFSVNMSDLTLLIKALTFTQEMASRAIVPMRDKGPEDEFNPRVLKTSPFGPCTIKKK